MITDWQFYLLAVPAVILMGVSKGGFSGLSVLSMPLLSLAVSPVKAAAIMLPILIIQDVVSVWAYRSTWDRRNLAILIPGALAGVILGYALAAKVQDTEVKFVVGLIAAGFVIYTYWRQRIAGELKPHAADVPRGLFWGGLTGFTSFVAHAGAPPFQVYVMPQQLAPQIYVGTSVICFAIVNWLKVLPYLLLGQFSRENLETSGALFPIAVVSTLAGVWLVRRVDAQSFYTVIYVLTFGVGVWLIGESLWAM
ncbi:sulfite exporter TauE/SafE family protein [Methylovirgula sp. 4M-Z18]|uniref:sulfite exporter TauE/SafE family protein n=1 Tax=Methylovirgula sp. 4M-Z18 TaxID=2293567 RepID=UPI000E2FD744|nr:sulfite exporter TauE/SafE family protein [Methylovirgula sp. 4M-Z18]RFB78376.1 sulfite exporter TauE/SafE family protein [Methylovirgula sp. 4M-Z18]